MEKNGPGIKRKVEEEVDRKVRKSLASPGKVLKNKKQVESSNKARERKLG